LFDAETDFPTVLGADPRPSCVLIDEAQFLTESQVSDLHRFAHVERVPVICYGIRSDFQGRAFPGSRALLTLADDLEEMKTVCRCGRKATFNMRVDATGRRVTEGAQVEIGGNERYEAVCPLRFYTDEC
jgi:thymidine kinase